MPTVQDVTSNTKIAIVTGGSRGLGRNTLLSLAKRGVLAIFTYNSNRAEAEKVVGLVGKTGQKAVALELDAGNRRAARSSPTAPPACDSPHPAASIDSGTVMFKVVSSLPPRTSIRFPCPRSISFRSSFFSQACRCRSANHRKRRFTFTLRQATSRV